MKKIFILTLISILAISFTNAQVGEKVTINASELTPEQRSKIEAQQKLEQANAKIEELQEKIDTYGKWVGVGGEVGTAVKEGLTAVVDVADKFGKTDVGKFTMVMIAWKVVGKDVIQIILGIFFFIVLTIVIVKVYRRVVIPRKVLIEDPGFLRYPKKYQVIEPTVKGEDSVWMTVILLVVFLIGIWITYAIMF